MKPPYHINKKILQLASGISEKIGLLNVAQLSKPPTELRKSNKIKTIHSSLEIEGNTLTVEQITSIIENKRVLAPEKDILEVKNAINVYNNIDKLKVYSLDSFCHAHGFLMKGLIASAGSLRTKSVGVLKGSKVAHVAPPSKMVQTLIKNLFDYLKNDDDLILIKSCVFHYEVEFIHPFMDGNGRMGRLWQTLILKEISPIFEFLPMEVLIKERQKKYYEALSKSDKRGDSTAFVEFMLKIIFDSLEEVSTIQNIRLTHSDRIDIFKSHAKENFFTRKDYLEYFKDISSATASRDLKFAVEQKLLKKFGDKNTTRYKYK